MEQKEAARPHSINPFGDAYKDNDEAKNIFLQACGLVEYNDPNIRHVLLRWMNGEDEIGTRYNQIIHLTGHPGNRWNTGQGPLQLHRKAEHNLRSRKLQPRAAWPDFGTCKSCSFQTHIECKQLPDLDARLARSDGQQWPPFIGKVQSIRQRSPTEEACFWSRFERVRHHTTRVPLSSYYVSSVSCLPCSYPCQKKTDRVHFSKMFAVVKLSSCIILHLQTSSSWKNAHWILIQYLGRSIVTPNGCIINFHQTHFKFDCCLLR